MRKSKEREEREQELVFAVRIKTFGRPDVVSKSCGKTLARIVGLNFNQASVHMRTKNGEKVEWTAFDRHGVQGEA